jgi:hypothetical protein
MCCTHRWKMIEESNAHVISLVELERLYPLKAEADDANNTNNTNNNGNNSNIRTKSFDEVRDEFKTSAFTGAGISAGAVAGTASDPYDRRDHKKNVLSAGSRGNNFYINLSEYEQDVYSRLTPYFDGALPLHEIAWRERLVEEDIFRLLKRNPDVLVYQA